VAVRV